MARHDDDEVKPETVADEVTGIQLERKDSADRVSLNGVSLAKSARDQPNGFVSSSKPSATSELFEIHSSIKKDDKAEDNLGSGIAVKPEPGQPAKLGRTTSSQKVIPRVAPLFDHLPDKTAEATSTFQVMDACIYANKYMGYTEHGMECDCAEEWGKSNLLSSCCHYY
jgi:histone-lysine N-methyltransferase SETD2